MLLIAWQGPSSALNIGPLLDSYPQFDPAYTQIRSDFDIRRNGVPVGDVFCAEPVSQLPISQYTDELILLQGLRAVFYMDLGPNHLPWAPGTLYGWMKSKMAGIDISDTALNSACCEQLDGKLFFILKAQDDFSRDFDRGWRGIAGNIDLYAHELRHIDGFPHVSCCGIPGGCDQTYARDDVRHRPRVQPDTKNPQLPRGPRVPHTAVSLAGGRGCSAGRSGRVRAGAGSCA